MILLRNETLDLILSNFDRGGTSQICPPRGALSQICPPRVAFFKPFNISPGAKIQKNDVCLRYSTQKTGTSDCTHSTTSSILGVVG
jgi:hypothetical protein